MLLARAREDDGDEQCYSDVDDDVALRVLMSTIKSLLAERVWIYRGEDGSLAMERRHWCCYSLFDCPV